MFIHSQPADPKVHEQARCIASECVWIIQAVLREEERLDAMREFYSVARRILEEP